MIAYNELLSVEEAIELAYKEGIKKGYDAGYSDGYYNDKDYETGYDVQSLLVEEGLAKEE